jgi:hypothetical protein
MDEIMIKYGRLRRRIFMYFSERMIRIGCGLEKQEALSFAMELAEKSGFLR